tara:strand:- start:607 stop:735 length:129 start_codon:yes stop_codon:yes gene_type:complete
MNRYGLKDLITDLAIISVVLGIVLVIVGSFPEFFGKVLPFIN